MTTATATATATAETVRVGYGHVEPVAVHFDDLDAMGIVHNSRYAVLLERALTAFWAARGHSFHGGRPTTPDVFNAVKEYHISYHAPIRGTGEVAVHFWLERLGESSGVYGFQMVSSNGTQVFAEGRRVVVKLDPRTLRPAPWTQAARTVAATLLRPA